MKTIIFLSYLAAGAAAQMITAAPNLNEAAVFADVDPSDPTYSLCTDAESLISGCLANNNDADQTAFLSCVCCISQTDIAPVYATCSDYISEEIGSSAATEYEAFATLYSACGQASALCEGGLGATGAVGGSGGSFPTTGPAQTATQIVASSTSSADVAVMTTSIPSTATPNFLPTTITSSAALTSIDPGCASMVGLFSSCVARVPNFSELPYGEQASCYCCQGSGTWTNALDSYASQCAEWASTADPGTVYSVASTFANFCDNFSDACSATATATGLGGFTMTSNEATTTGGDGGNNGGQATVTVTQTGTHKGAGAHLDSSMAAMLAIAVFALVA